MIMQIAMVPNIYNWTENAPINPNKKEESSESTEEDNSENFLAYQYLTFWDQCMKRDEYHPWEWNKKFRTEETNNRSVPDVDWARKCSSFSKFCIVFAWNFLQVIACAL